MQHVTQTRSLSRVLTRRPTSHQISVGKALQCVSTNACLVFHPVREETLLSNVLCFLFLSSGMYIKGQNADWCDQDTDKEREAIKS